MFYKNTKVYRITGDVDLTDVDDKLAEFPNRDCGTQEMATIGWNQHYCQHNVHTFVLRKQEKILPAKVINLEVQKRVKDIEAATGGEITLTKKATQDIKSQVIFDFLPRAFTKETDTWGFISLVDKILVINTSSDSQAEVYLALLRKTLGSLPVEPWFPFSVSNHLNDWLLGPPEELPEEITVLECAKVIKPDDTKSKVVFTEIDLSDEKVKEWVEAGGYVSELAIEWSEQLNCMLCADGTIKKIKWADVIVEHNDDIPKSEVLARLDADLFLNNTEITRFVIGCLDQYLGRNEDV